MHVRGRGRREVRLESAVPVARDDKATRPTWSFGLRFPAAAVVRGQIEAPAGGRGARRPGLRPDLPRLPGRPAGRFVALPATEVRWTLSGRATVPRRAQLPLRFEATSATASTLSRTRLQVLGWIEVRVAQGRLETLRVPVPAGLEVADVRGPYAGWKVEAGTLVVTPLAPVEDTLAVEIVLTGDPQDRFATPLLSPRGAPARRCSPRRRSRGTGILSPDRSRRGAGARGARGGPPAGLR